MDRTTSLDHVRYRVGNTPTTPALLLLPDTHVRCLRCYTAQAMQRGIRIGAKARLSYVHLGKAVHETWLSREVLSKDHCHPPCCGATCDVRCCFCSHCCGLQPDGDVLHDPAPALSIAAATGAPTFWPTPAWRARQRVDLDCNGFREASPPCNPFSSSTTARLPLPPLSPLLLLPTMTLTASLLADSYLPM